MVDMEVMDMELATLPTTPDTGTATTTTTIPALLPPTPPIPTPDPLLLILPTLSLLPDMAIPATATVMSSTRSTLPTSTAMIKPLESTERWTVITIPAITTPTTTIPDIIKSSLYYVYFLYFYVINF